MINGFVMHYVMMCP